MKIFKTTILSGIISFIKITSGFIAGKVVALITGPVGVAYVGSFTNFITIVLTFANGAINNGVIKYTAESESNNIQLKNLFSTALRISIFCSLIVSIIIFFAASNFSILLFNNLLFVNPIRVLAVTIVFYSLNSLLLAILNGKSSINSYTIINTLGSLFALVLTVVLVYYYKVIGALYALALSQTLVFFISVTLLIKTEWFSYKFFNKKFNKKIARKLGNYSFMAVITALTIPVSQIIVRNYLIEKVGVNSGGYWQAMTRISDGYLMIVTTSLSTYYLPKLSKLKSNKDIKAEIFKVYKLILPFVLASCIIIYYLRFYIINLLFSASFIEIESLFLFQLIGDFFKISAWIIAYLMIAKAMTKTFIVTEIIFSLSYLALNYFLINNFGLIGSIYAFTINYFIYLIVMIGLFKNKFLNVNE